MRPALLILALAVLPGCYPAITVEDNAPDRAEREDAWSVCAGASPGVVRLGGADVAANLRVACTQAIYGGSYEAP